MTATDTPEPATASITCKLHGTNTSRLYAHHKNAAGQTVYRPRCPECHKARRRRWTHAQRRALKVPERPARRVAPEELEKLDPKTEGRA